MRASAALGDELRDRLGSPTGARRLDSSPRSRVWRAELGGTTVVIKQMVDGPDASLRFGREVTALRLASRADPPLVPAILGTDPGRRVMVLEYVDSHDPPEDWVVGYGAALARLHATATPDDAGALPRWSPPSLDDVSAFLALAAELGLPASAAVSAELGGLVDRLQRTARHSLLHGDPCPGNDLHTSGGLRFVDFEQAALGDGLVELAYLRIGFPTCWCVTAPPEPLLRRAEEAYRTAWRDATGAELQGDLADACAGWLLRGDALVEKAHRQGIDHLARIPREDWHWGTATARQRLLHRLGVVAETTRDHARLAGLGEFCAAMRGRVLTRWPALQPLPSRRP
ncbi:phosphotransferase family protein [Sphaerisporangium perillae]|uniref:phosphotransferase family protein n=1 Tax=Sphaerisporangium perillae TaxID=2935860 RepID=UPI00200CD7AB|nr:aminoglycoside phosphotransferase family protein [Sphaerisporangium perillae]